MMARIGETPLDCSGDQVVRRRPELNENKSALGAQVLRQRVVQPNPAEQCTLDAHGELTNTLKLLDIAKNIALFLGNLFALQQPSNRIDRRMNIVR